MPAKLIAGLVILVFGDAQKHFQLAYQWNTIEPIWTNPAARKEAIQSHKFIPQNNLISGIKIWNNRIFLTVPRWKPGVPITLGFVSANGHDLEPYPSLKMQEIGNCESFQLVQSMEIDVLGRMWVLDSGRTEIFTRSPKRWCPPRLVILDLENNGQVLLNHVFHDMTSNQTFLNDIVVDHEDGGFAYITDTDETDPGIVVFSLKSSTSWKIRHKSMIAEKEAVEFRSGGTLVTRPFSVDGIALSPAGNAKRCIYYCPLSSFYLYSLPTSILKNKIMEVDGFVENLGRKASTADGMVMDSKGVLYFGALMENGVVSWDSKRCPSFASGQKRIEKDVGSLEWPDTFAIDGNGTLWLVASSAGKFVFGEIDVTVPNFRIFKMEIGARSYQYSEFWNL